MIKLGCVLCYISNLFRPIISHKQNIISLQKTNSCLLENNTKVLGNDEADVNNQMSRKYKEENIRSYLKRFNSLVALMPTLRAGFSALMYKEQSWVQLLFLSVIWVFFEIAELMWDQASRGLLPDLSDLLKLAEGNVLDYWDGQLKDRRGDSGDDNDRNQRWFEISDLRRCTEEVSVNNW